MKIEVFSDIACPYCYLGMRHLALALEQFEHGGDIEVEWRAFQLDPNAPADGALRVSDWLVSHRGLSPDQVAASQAQLRERGAAAGLELDTAGTVVANTRDAHRLILFARPQGLAEAMAQRLFRANFAEHANVADPAVLTRLAVEVGLDETAVRELLAGEELAYEVAADQREAADFGVRGVPFFVLDRRFAVSGAQPVEVFSEALGEAWQAAAGHDQPGQ